MADNGIKNRCLNKFAISDYYIYFCEHFNIIYNI